MFKNKKTTSRLIVNWPCGLMDKAPDFGSGDCRFESCQGHIFFSSIKKQTKKVYSQPNTLFGGQINCFSAADSYGLFVVYPHVNISISVCADVSILRTVVSYCVLQKPNCNYKKWSQMRYLSLSRFDDFACAYYEFFINAVTRLWSGSETGLWGKTALPSIFFLVTVPKSCILHNLNLHQCTA